jgi:hypothetical protein
MNEKYCFVVTQNIETATCALLFKWLTKKDNITVFVSSEENLISDLNKLSLNEFKFVYVVGFYNLSKLPNEYDKKNILFINKIFKSKPNFENKNIISGDVTTVSLFYNFIKKYCDEDLTGNQTIFFNSVNNYLKYDFEDLLPLKLFYFFKTQPVQNKVEAFIKRFDTGLIMFTEQENHKLTVIQKELANILKNIKSYSGALSYNDTHYSIVATFGSKFINEISHRILKKSNRDISVCIDLEKKVAYYRKNKTLKVDLGELVHKCFSGYGTEFAAFSPLNESLLELTKTFYSS